MTRRGLPILPKPIFFTPRSARVLVDQYVCSAPTEASLQLQATKLIGRSDVRICRLVPSNLVFWVIGGNGGNLGEKWAGSAAGNLLIRTGQSASDNKKSPNRFRGASPVLGTVLAGFLSAQNTIVVRV